MRDKEAKMLSGYADTLSSEHVAPLDAVKYMEAFMQRSKLNLAAVIELEGKIQQVEEEIRLETERHRERKGSTDARVTMVVGAENDGPAHLKLTYSERSRFPPPHLYVLTPLSQSRPTRGGSAPTTCTPPPRTADPEPLSRSSTVHA